MEFWKYIKTFIDNSKNIDFLLVAMLLVNVS